MINHDSSLGPAATFKDRVVRSDVERPRTGHDLSLLLSSGPAPTALVIPSFLSVIEAVEELHRGNRGPCNLDPQKIRFSSDGTAQLSTLVRAGSGMTLTIGSLKYSAPEAFEETNGQTDAALIDSYVVGFVFYEILLGKDLFERQFHGVSGQGDFAWLAWHADRSRRAKPLSEILTGFPPVLSSLIEGMMSKEVSQRITDLQTISNTLGVASQATMTITNVSALRAGGRAHMRQLLSLARKVDAICQSLVDAIRDRLRTLPWHRIAAKEDQQTRLRANTGRPFFRPGGAEQAGSVRAYDLPNSRRGSGLKR